MKTTPSFLLTRRAPRPACPHRAGLCHPAAALLSFLPMVFSSYLYKISRRSFSLPPLPPLLLLLPLLAGCASSAARRTQNQAFLAEESRALTSAVAESLALQPSAQRDPHSATALLFARQDQRLEGLPLRPIDVQPVLEQMAATNQPGPALERRFAIQDKALARQAEANARLLDAGLQAEQARAASTRFWTRWLARFSVPLLLLAGLLILFPAAAPFLGRFLAWIVSLFPRLASYAGVVGLAAFDAVVRGIERSRAEEENLAPLERHLSREMDQSHKRLVRSRKSSLRSWSPGRSEPRHP